MKYIKWFKALPLPLMVGLIVVTLTMGVVLANFMVTRYLTLTSSGDPFTVSEGSSINLYEKGTVEYGFTVTNTSAEEIQVQTALVGNEPFGLDVTIDQPILTLAASEEKIVTAICTDNGSFTGGDIGFTFEKV